MVEIREVLRAWLSGSGHRTAAAQAGVDRKTARRYVDAAVAAGLDRERGVGQLSDELIGAVVAAVRPDRPQGHGAAWESLCANHDQINDWVAKGLTVVKVGDLLARRGVIVPQRTLHRYCVERTDYRGRGGTVPVVDGEPGVECQIDFARMGMLTDSVRGRRRVVHALIFTAVYSRHMFVWLTFSQTLQALIDGCEAAWRFFGGVFKVLIPDNMVTVVAHADSVNPRFTVGWLEYGQARGFVTDPARVAHPQDKPRMVQYVRNNFFAGEDFTDLADAQARAQAWCAEKAGQRIHGTTCARPAVVFAETEATLLLTAPATPYAVPIYAEVKVHRDFHVQVGKALYSIPEQYRGQTISARADGELVKMFHRGQLVKTHPRQPPGGRSTDPIDLPAEKTGYAMRDLDRLIATAAGHGTNIGIYAERLLDHNLPWTKMRQVYRLLGLVKRYGPDPTDTACGRALDLDVVPVTKIAAMLEKATENAQQPPPRAANRAGPGPVRPRPRRIPHQLTHPGHAGQADPAGLADRHRRRRRRRARTGATVMTKPTKDVVTDPVSADLKHVMRQLKLGRMLDTLPERLILAGQRHMSHAAFLELVLADEATRRDTSSAARRARDAGLDPAMHLEVWDETAAVRYDRTLWADLTSLRFLDGPHGALLLGAVGVGKTHLATALGHIAVRRKIPTLMLRADSMFKRLRASRLDNSTEAEMRRLAQVRLLIIDDFALQPMDATATADFYELVVARHQKVSTVLTSNRTPDEWLAVMTDPLLAQSAVDRLTSTAHELVVEGHSYRRRQKPSVDS